MREYKVVPCHGRIVIKPKANPTSAFEAYAEIISNEALGGWELVSAMPVGVVSKKKGLKANEEPYNALIFTRIAPTDGEESK